VLLILIFVFFGSHIQLSETILHPEFSIEITAQFEFKFQMLLPYSKVDEQYKAYLKMNDYIDYSVDVGFIDFCKKRFVSIGGKF
jgi:hypothetical protein